MRSRYRNWIGIALAVLVYSGLVFYGGVRYGRPSEQSKDVVAALKNVTDTLKAVRAQATVLAHADTVASAVAATSRDSVRVHGSAVDRAAAAVHVSTDVRDSLVMVQRPTVGADDKLADSLTSLPLPIATYIRESKAQLLRYAVAVHDDTVSMKAKDARIVELEKADSLAKAQDSIHVGNERQLAKDVVTAHRAGFVLGAKVGAAIVAVGLLAAKILIH